MSGTIPDGLADAVARGERPRADYDVMAAAMDADVVDVPTALAATRRPVRWLGKLAGGTLVLAWYCFRRRHDYQTLMTDSEQVGFPYAVLARFVRRRPRHVMIAHRLSPPKKLLVHRALGLHRRVDGVVVYSTPQQRVAIDRLHYEPSRVLLTPFMVDTAFWRSGHDGVPERERPLISAVGQELRDYPTLAAAARHLPIDVMLAAASPWSRRADSSKDIEVPANVQVSRFGPADLRTLYDESALVVVPLVETDFQAGITTILEAMSMERAIICTRTEGQTDTLVDGVTAVYVPPGDVDALRDSITRLLSSADDAAALARAARAWVVEHGDIEVYGERLARFAADIGHAGDGPTSPSGSS